MNHPAFPGRRPFTPSLLDILLSDIAIRIQLSKTDYDKAVSRFGTMQDWIDREESPLKGLVRLMYPQGSMAIGATISRVSERDEFDIDIMVDLLVRRDANPQLVLDMLHDAIRGTKGTRYWGMTTRHTRCVCVTFADGMHLDLTPAVLVPDRLQRTSIIFHSKPEDRNVPDQHLFANPWGLADWFMAGTPADADFASFFEQRSIGHYAAGGIVARAPAEDVPDQEPAYRKSKALVALQLIKRWRNVLFSARERQNLRRPPSVLLSKLICDNANRTTSLSEEVEHQARCILHRLETETSLQRLIHEVNPRCHEDVLTDRWPGDIGAQLAFIGDLRHFVGCMQTLRTGNLSIGEMSEILEELFGQRPARKAVNDYIASAPSGGNRVIGQTGRVIGAGSGISSPAFARQVPGHNFFGR